MNIELYKPCYYKQFNEFIETVFAENGITFEREEKHRDLLNIMNVYISFYVITDETQKIYGCAGFKPYDYETKTVEMKRLYLLKCIQGLGYGQSIMRTILEDAKSQGYQYIRLDTKPQFFKAISLINKNGFYHIARYNNSTATLFFEKRL